MDFTSFIGVSIAFFSGKVNPKHTGEASGIGLSRKNVNRILSLFATYEGAGMLLSCTEQESNQRSRLGGGVESKAYRSCLDHPALYPAFEPPSPQTPLPALVASLAVIVFNPIRKDPPTRPGGVHRGGRLGVGVEVLDNGSNIDRLRFSASPMPASFGSFLAGQEKNRTAPCTC